MGTEKDPETLIILDQRGHHSAAGHIAPHRDDEVAAWLRAKRDEVKQQHPGYDSRGAVRYDAIDYLLDEWKLRADLGLRLANEIPEGLWG